MSRIYHVTTKAAWQKALQQQQYVAPSLHTEGFIHCSLPQQLAGVLQRYYQNEPDLLVLEIDAGKLQHKLQYDMSPSVNELFPHVYGPINLDAVINIQPIG